jgi:hypothetical protein
MGRSDDDMYVAVEARAREQRYEAAGGVLRGIRPLAHVERPDTVAIAIPVAEAECPDDAQTWVLDGPECTVVAGSSVVIVDSCRDSS